MKKLLLFIAVLMFSTSVMQGQTLQKFFDKYADDERFQYVSINRGLMNMASVFGGMAKDEKQMMSKMHSLRILTLEGASNSTLFSTVENELRAIVEKGNFETAVEVREKGERVNIYYRVAGQDDADMLIVTKEKGEFTCIWIKGKMTRDEMLKSFSSNDLMQEDWDFF
jgi:hypothetical protein